MTFSLVVGAGAQPPVTPSPEPPGIALAPTQLPRQTVQDTALLLLKAVEGDSYGDFAAAITDDFKAALPAKAFQDMSEPLAPRLQKGYDLVYMGNVEKGEYTTYVWKIAFRDQKFDRNTINEVLMTFTIKDVHQTDRDTAKVAGFFLD